MNSHTFQTKLESNIIHLINIGDLIGKEVIVTIIEIPEHKDKKKREWNYLGAINLDKKADEINVRDLAYE